MLKSTNGNHVEAAKRVSKMIKKNERAMMKQAVTVTKQREVYRHIKEDGGVVVDNEIKVPEIILPEGANLKTRIHDLFGELAVCLAVLSASEPMVVCPDAPAILQMFTRGVKGDYFLHADNIIVPEDQQKTATTFPDQMIKLFHAAAPQTKVLDPSKFRADAGFHNSGKNRKAYFNMTTAIATSPADDNNDTSSSDNENDA